MTARIVAILTLLAGLVAAGASLAQDSSLRLAVTTSFHNSGLSDVLLPAIEEDLGLRVELLVVGTGQALRLGRAGDVDAVLVHSRAAEEAFVADGFGTHRREVMYNDFVLVGPEADPAGIASARSVREAFERIAAAEAVFASRGDDSGTHRRELELWQDAGVDVDAASGTWYRATGGGMGATLNVATGMDAYALTDRASWLNFANKGDLTLLYEGDPRLFNQYAYLPVDPARHAHVNAQGAQALERWLTSPKGQSMIGDHAIGGERLFVPNAAPSGGSG